MSKASNSTTPCHYIFFLILILAAATTTAAMNISALQACNAAIEECEDPDLEEEYLMESQASHRMLQGLMATQKQRDAYASLLKLTPCDPRVTRNVNPNNGRYCMEPANLNSRRPQTYPRDRIRGSTLTLS
uniref:Uncharacterized protein n=1 Tax=Kalanchoe fedtschenkoi TaxID=63787 RepID=A0A7N0U1K0_KALFE